VLVHNSTYSPKKKLNCALLCLIVLLSITCANARAPRRKTPANSTKLHRNFMLHDLCDTIPIRLMLAAFHIGVIHGESLNKRVHQVCLSKERQIPGPSYRRFHSLQPPQICNHKLMLSWVYLETGRSVFRACKNALQLGTPQLLALRSPFRPSGCSLTGLSIPLFVRQTSCTKIKPTDVSIRPLLPPLTS